MPVPNLIQVQLVFVVMLMTFLYKGVLTIECHEGGPVFEGGDPPETTTKDCGYCRVSYQPPKDVGTITIITTTASETLPTNEIGPRKNKLRPTFEAKTQRNRRYEPPKTEPAECHYKCFGPEAEKPAMGKSDGENGLKYYLCDNGDLCNGRKCTADLSGASGLGVKLWILFTSTILALMFGG